MGWCIEIERDALGHKYILGAYTDDMRPLGLWIRVQNDDPVWCNDNHPRFRQAPRPQNCGPEHRGLAFYTRPLDAA